MQDKIIDLVQVTSVSITSDFLASGWLKVKDDHTHGGASIVNFEMNFDVADMTDYECESITNEIATPIGLGCFLVVLSFKVTVATPDEVMPNAGQQRAMCITALGKVAQVYEAMNREIK